MKKIVFLLAFLVYTEAAGQSLPVPSRDAELQRQREAAQNQRQAEVSAQRIRVLAENRYRGKVVPRAVIGDIRELYRVPTPKELRKLRPLSEDLHTYARFLRQRRTGLIRLEPYIGCGDGTRVVSASEECLQYPFPGNGSDYSFRERNYRLGRLADIRFGPSGFSSPGIFQQAIFVGLGDISLDQVSLNSPGLSYLKNFAPAERVDEAISFSREFESGRKVDGYFYAPALRAVDNMTYVLRSVAYEGPAVRAIGGFVFNETDFDERADIVVAFRIIRTHENGAVSILWKELSRMDPPKMQRKTRENRDPNRFTAKRK